MRLSDLTPVYDAEGPFVTIYLDTTSEVARAADELELRWKNMLRELTDLGVHEATRDALTEARGGHAEGNTTVLIAAGREVVFRTTRPEPPVQEVVRVATLPHLLPLVDSVQLQVPHIVVLTDRQGADVLAYADTSDPALSEVVKSGRYPLRKVGTGGNWGELHHMHKVENSWEASAKEIAHHVDGLSQAVGAKLVIAAGDDRATTLLGEHLPQALQDDYQVIAGGRAADGSSGHVATRVLEVVGERVAKDVIDLLGDFAQERGQHDRAADGVEATIGALRMGAVGTLLITQELEEERRLFFGPSLELAALTRQELVDLGVEDPQSGALADVLVRAALGTAADIRLVPAGLEEAPTGGVGALLRFPTTPAEPDTA